jgi:putative membrane protein
MSEAIHQILADWSLPIWLTAAIVITAGVYLRGWLAIRRTRPLQFTGLRLGSFFAGLGVLWLAIGSPMDGFADVLLSAHMVEHLLLMSVVPPLLLYGLPLSRSCADCRRPSSGLSPPRSCALLPCADSGTGSSRRS